MWVCGHHIPRNDPPRLWKTNNRQKSGNGKSGLGEAVSLSSESTGKAVVTPEHPPHKQWMKPTGTRQARPGSLTTCVTYDTVAFPRYSVKIPWRKRSCRQPGILFSMTHCTWARTGLPVSFSQWSCLCKQVKEDTESWAEGLGELSPAEKLKDLQ